MQDYTGVRELIIKDEDLQAFYEDGRDYKFLTNEYVKVRNEQGEVIYLGKWNGEKFEQLKYKKIDSDYFGDIKPLNDEQKMLFSLLQDDNIMCKVILGSYGTGKSYCSLCWAINEITSKHPKYNCLHYIRNNIICKDTVDIGCLPSTATEKLKPWALEMADILGSENILDLYIEQGLIKLENIGFSRGRSWGKSVVFLEEGQNTTTYIMSLLMGRVSKDSCFIIVGDMRQADRDIFTRNSGINKAIDKLKGNPLFGLVTLQKNERSELSSLADLLLE